MVKPAEKFKPINIHHLSGADIGGEWGRAAKPAVNQAVDSIMEVAEQLPVLKKISESVELNLEQRLALVSKESPDEKWERREDLYTKKLKYRQ